ncbi:YJR112W-A [Zygosaccharomyces parabailii]|nr:YJR112W-A [Zygosaccharomyces parabailii]
MLGLTVDIRWKYACVFCSSSLLCLYLGVVTDNAIADIVQNHDKLVHFLAFFIESWLFVCMLASKVIKFPIWWSPQDARQHFCIGKYTLGLLVCLTAAVGSEYLQKVLSRGRRTFDPMDIAYNVIGSFLGIATAYYWG